MKRIHLLVYIFMLLLTNEKMNGQTLSTKNITTDLPQIIPPSPTVSSLMKFEEVPVSHYTGVPDISVPLISVPSNSKDISVNISLKYHTSSIAADEISSDVGLGWNLFAGGTVSRTVKGHPDEELILASSSKPGKLGIYQTSVSNHINNFYYFSKNLLNDYKTYYKPNLSADDKLIANEFIWTANRTDKYDTEQDLWQFNFFGKTGRFYIKKNDLGSLEIVPLDHYNIKIVNHYDGSTYKPTGFTIFDDIGYKYVFDIIEVSNNSGGTRNYYYDNNEILTPIDNLFEDKEFNSSFHLSKVIDPNNNTLIEYQYNENEIKEGFTKATYREAEFGNLGTNLSAIYKLYNVCGDFPPVRSFNRSSTVVRVKKLSQINITGVGKIKFNYVQNREDSNLMLPETASSLKSITLLNWNNGFIKKYDFTQEYRTVLEKRMFLSKIEEIDKNNQIIGNYKFSYETNDFIGKRIGKDFWGYFNASDECDINSSFEHQRNTNPAYSTTDILQKITYPTGGASIFDFESNQYSYIGNNLIPNFSENKTYTLLSVGSLYFHKNSVDHVVIPISTSNRKAVFYSSIVLTDLNTRKFSLEIQNGKDWEVVYNSLSCPSSVPICCVSFILEKNKKYRVKWSNFDIYYNGTDILGIHYFEENSVVNNFLYGGGNRIRRIGYFDKDAPADYYKFISNGSSAPAQEKKYIYTHDNNTTLSSGSLVDPQPLFRYTDSFTAKLKFGPYNVGASCAGVINNHNFSYDMVTTENNIPLFKTQGSAVGYKYITVEEGTNKGKITYEYTSPLDFQNSLYPQGPPFVQPKDFDYKRGNLVKQTVYDNNSRKLSEVENTYAYEDYEEFTGIRFTKPNSIYNGTSENYPQSFAIYQQLLNSGCMICNSNYSTPKEFWGGMPLDANTPNFIPVPVFEAYGWTKLMSTKTKNYFYDNGSQRTAEKNESYQYNNLNKQISQHILNTENDNELKTKYYYHSGNSVYSQNRISEIEKIESYKNNKLQETKKINYSNNWSTNFSVLPSQILNSYGNEALEGQITYNQYDSKGNILQYTTKDGVSTAIIWGYNFTQPIAKITGLSYSEVSSLVSDIIAASDADAADPSAEDALITALDNFRIQPALTGALITTYTYDPLIGATSVTPPSGIREVYLYDSANRLKEIRENNISGKVLKEFKYNYKH